MAPSILSPVGPIGAAERTILLDSLAIMLAIVVPTLIATITFAWWFRSGNRRARYLPAWAYSGELELLVWSIPALVVLFLGGIAWVGSHDLDPAHPLPSSVPAVEVEVVSLDWKWLFIYPQQRVASLNRMIVPAGVPLHLRLTSATVMNVFFVPGMGSEIYTMNGMATQLNLQADRPGTFPGLSAQFSGDGFSGMAFDLVAMTGSEFARWTAATRQGGEPLDEAAYRKLLRQSQNDPPRAYGGLTPGLFERIVSQQLPPGEGPPAEQTASAVSPSGGR